MQTPDGRLHEMGQGDQTKFAAMFKPDGTPDSHAPVVREGDVFRIRGCYFRVSELHIDNTIIDGVARNGFYAIGITRDEYDKAKGMG